LATSDKSIALKFEEQSVSRRGETRYLLTARFQHRGASRSVSFLINGKGEITSFDNHGVTPDFPMCAAPTLKPDDPRVVAKVIGKNGWRFTGDGKRVPFRVTKLDAVSPLLRLVIRKEGAPHEWFLGYNVVVDALGTQYFVNGETGELIE
jgi:hypothetical protein